MWVMLGELGPLALKWLELADVIKLIKQMERDVCDLNGKCATENYHM
jgi:hypothetical protein